MEGSSGGLGGCLASSVRQLNPPSLVGKPQAMPPTDLSRFVVLNPPPNKSQTQEIDFCWRDGCNEVSSPERRFKTCRKCKRAYYCGPACQRDDWKEHRKECGPLPSNVTRELAASGQSVDSLGLVPGSSFVTLIEFQTQMENTIKEHNSSLAWALYQALHLSDPANVPANHALGQALILDFTSTHMEGGTGFYIRYASVAFGPLATYRAETPGEWVNYDAFLKGLQGPGHESRMLGVVVVRLGHRDDWFDVMADTFNENAPIQLSSDPYVGFCACLRSRCARAGGRGLGMHTVKAVVKTTSTSKKAASTSTKKMTTSAELSSTLSTKVVSTTSKAVSTTSKATSTSSLKESMTTHVSSTISAITTTPSSSSNGNPLSTVRGVNLGGLFIVEPWMMASEWARIGCAGQNSEFDCMANASLSAVAQAGFISHWDTWITQGDIANISLYGLNTIRIPIGYWFVEDLVNRTSEYYATGGFFYLKRVCGWAADAGLNVILDLHGAPGSQAINQAFTGQDTTHAGFFTSSNYNRAYKWLTNMTIEVHMNKEFRTVFALEVVNEPLQGEENFASNYYPGAFNAVRNAEFSLNISCSSSSSSSTVSSSSAVNLQCLSIQFMDTTWGAGSAKIALESLPSTPLNVIYDGHDYNKWSSANLSRAGYLEYSGTSSHFFTASSTPLIVGEWSLGVSDTYVPELANNAAGASAFFYQWASAQMSVFEQGRGWIFWTWKTDTLNDPQWDYQLAVQAGYLPSNAGGWNTSACAGY